MKKLPKYLYHYTTLLWLEFIREDGYLKVTNSNLKVGNATLRMEPIIRNGEIVGQRAVNKYSDYHPVVWLTANENAVADENGLYEAKIQCRLTIPTKGRRWKFLKWTDFLSKYHADPIEANRLKRFSGADWKNWYVCEEPISLSDVSRIDGLQPDGTYAPIE